MRGYRIGWRWRPDTRIAGDGVAVEQHPGVEWVRLRGQHHASEDALEDGTSTDPSGPEQFFVDQVRQGILDQALRDPVPQHQPPVVAPQLEVPGAHHFGLGDRQDGVMCDDGDQGVLVGAVDQRGKRIDDRRDDLAAHSHDHRSGPDVGQNRSADGPEVTRLTGSTFDTASSSSAATGSRTADAGPTYPTSPRNPLRQQVSTDKLPARASRSPPEESRHPAHPVR